MFAIRICKIDKDKLDAIWIWCNDQKKEIGYTIQNILFKKFTTPFVVNIVFQSVGLAWIVESKNNLNFDVRELCPSCLGDGTWYNPTICLQVFGYSFENLFNARIKDRYALKCDIDAYNKQKPPIGPEYATSDGDKYLSSTSSTKSLDSLGYKLECIDQWLQYFDAKYSNENTMYYAKIRELFRTIPQNLPEKNLVSTKKHQT